MSARTPHRGSLGAVEHPELERTEIRDDSGISAERINLPDDLPLGDSADGRVAGHLGKTGQVHRNKEDRGPEISRGHSSFTAGMTSANNDDIILPLHLGRQGFPQIKIVILLGTHHSDIRLGMVIISDQVQNAMDDDPVQFIIELGSEIQCVFTHRIYTDEKITGQDVTLAVIKCNDVRKVVMSKIALVYVQDIIVRTKNDIDRSQLTDFTLSNQLQPTGRKTLGFEQKRSIFKKIADHIKPKISANLQLLYKKFEINRIISNFTPQTDKTKTLDMELKKSAKASLENKKLIFTEIGLVIALLVVWGAFEYTSKEKKSSAFEAENAVVIEDEMVPITQETPPPPEAAPKIPVLSDQIDIVDDEIKLDDDTFMNLEDDANMGVEIMDYVEEVQEEVVEEEAIPFQLVEEKPSFNGGDANEFSNWVNSKLVYPEIAKENGVQGRVTLQFTVNADGSVSNVKVLRGVDSSLDKEAVRVVSSSPKWKPGKQRDRAVKVTYTFPVIFQLR